jgi:ABC-type transport system involved in cytochrome bd biosynthesis fused ATPase/permease subunit
MWDSPMHLLILFLFMLLFIVGIPVLFYRIGRKVGDATGYLRGYKDGQVSGKQP